MIKDEAWFKSIKWDKSCINVCHAANNGKCPFRECAEMNYDDNGNIIPLESICHKAETEMVQECASNENEDQVQTWEIFNHIYGDVCSDSWFGKESRDYTIGFVVDTEANVKALVAELNANRYTVFPRSEPEDEWDRDWEDANYIAYSKVKISTFDEIRKNWR